MTVVFGKLTPADAEDATEVLATALMVEPGFAHIYPDPEVRLPAMRIIIRGILAPALADGTVWAATEDGTVLGAAILAAPGTYPPADRADEQASPMDHPLAQFGIEQLLALEEFDRNAIAFFPKEPVWYLEILGVSPRAQGKGVGSGLLRAILAEIRDMPCYLETGAEANVRLYRRFGFEVVESAARLAPNNGPTHWTMLRPAS